MNDDSKWAAYRNLSFAPIQVSGVLQTSKTPESESVAEEALAQNGKHGDPHVDPENALKGDEDPIGPNGEAPNGEETLLTSGDELPPGNGRTLTMRRIGVGLAAVAGLGLVVIFLFRPTLPTAAPEATTVVAEAPGSETMPPGTSATTQSEAPTPAVTEAVVAAALPTEPEASQASVQEEAPARPTLAPTTAPTPTPLPPLTPIEAVPDAIAFVVGEPGQSDIASIQAGQLEPSFVVNEACDEAEPDWSPDGESLIFHSNCNGSYDIAEVPVGGGEVRYLTSAEGFDELDPSYSPDGKTVVFVSLLRGMDHATEGDLWAINMESGHTYPLEITGRAPVWSADGLRVAFMSMRAGKWDVYVHDFLSGEDSLISFGCPADCGWPEWSPDGTSIAYGVTGSPSSTKPEEIWLWREDSRLPRKWITGVAGRPSWSASGLVAYDSGEGLVVSNIENLERHLLVDDAAASAPEWAQ